jgi:ligand-binding sensor domain-containing protein
MLTIYFCHSIAYSQVQSEKRFVRLSSEQYSIEKGLSQNTITSILQDSRGFMWFGTWDGLNKYDGYSYEIYKPDIVNPGTAMSNKTAQALFEDKDGYIWVGTERGLNRFNRRNELFSQYFHESKMPTTLSSDTIICITGDNTGTLWIGTSNGLNAFHPETKTFERVILRSGKDDAFNDNSIKAIIADGFWLWVASATGIVRYNTSSGKIDRIFPDLSEPGAKLVTINCLSKCRDGSLLAGTSHGIYTIEPSVMKIGHLDLSKISGNPFAVNVVNALLEDKTGLLWIGTNGDGLSIYDRKTGHYERCFNEADDLQSLSNDFVSILYEDKSGIIWVGTLWNGVNQLVKNKYYFKHVFPVSNNNKSLNNNLVWCFLEENPDKIWIGTEKGINILDRKTSTYTYLLRKPGCRNCLAGNNIRVIFRDSRKDIWVATAAEGVSRFAGGNPSKIRNYLHDAGDPFSVGHNTVTNIAEDSAGNIWMATRGNGICRLDDKTGRFDHFRNKPGMINSLSSNIVWSVFFDRKNRLWAATSNGLSLYIPSTGKFRVFRHHPSDPASLSNDDIFTITEDKNGILWLGTIGGGLNRFDPETETFHYYTEKDGLSNNVIYNILTDDEGWLWMSTNYGISKFDPVNEIFYNYDVRDGIQSNEFNFGAALRLSTGEMMFGGMNGFNIFKPSDIRMNNYIPQVVVTQFKIFDKALPREFMNGDTIILTFNQNFFSIAFAALDYTNPQKNRHKYMLENVDKRWQLSEFNRHSANYTDVQPGLYTFRLIGSNNDGVWCDKEFKLTIIIKPPWYLTNQFRVGFIIFIIALVWFLIWRRIKKLKRKHAVETKVLTLENQILDVEKKALRLQMNPHFIFNAMNSIQSFILANEPDKAIHYLTRFSHLMRLILTNSKDSWVLLANEIKAIEYYIEIEKLRFDERFDFQLDIDPGIEPEMLEIPPMLIQPFVENAIIHGLLNKKDKGRILIHIAYQKGLLHCVVEDDGVGRESSRKMKEHSGLKRPSMGMFITGRRVDLLKTSSSERFGIKVIDLFSEKGEAAGTRVEIDIVPMVKHN